ncbi:hypothetical protein O3P69_016653 [Scylla paramamosain]|uniref:Uncharacterized protein n=1 Tax=Scylla paramamosain TaxID=85552 RepID=A0AAW0SYN6_SCYPA
MAASAGRRTLAQLYRQGWNEIPEVMASSYIMVLGLGLMGLSAYTYIKKDGDKKKYRFTYTVYRPDDPRVETIRK